MRVVLVKGLPVVNRRTVDQSGVQIVIHDQQEGDPKEASDADALTLFDVLYWALPSNTFEKLSQQMAERIRS